jgi:hypothetical protein
MECRPRERASEKFLAHDNLGNSPNDALSVCFADPTLANAFVARRCVGAKVETNGGVFQVWQGKPVPRARVDDPPDALSLVGASQIDPFRTYGPTHPAHYLGE